jgi:hypothetical protein
MQKYKKLYEYIYEFQKAIYDVYSKDAVSFLTTYYHIDIDETVWDDSQLFSGAYEKVGEFSGIRWNKFLLIPVYFSEEMTTAFDGSELGYTKDGQTSFVIPSSYGFTPLPNDKFKLDQTFLRPTNDVYPVYTVTGIEKSVNADRLFWRLKVQVEQSVTTDQLDAQVNDTYTFFDYTKKIYAIPDAEYMTNLLIKNSTLRTRSRTFFDQNSGFYLI